MRTEPEVRIRGEGIAALCCAHLLGRAGIRVSLERLDRPRVPAIMLSEAALGLLRDVFDRPALFADRARIERRVVQWGTASAPRSLPHAGIVLSEAQLIEALAPARPTDQASAPDFTIHTAPPLPAGHQLRFGERSGIAVRVDVNDVADRASCWMEAVDGGWLFLLPDPSGSAWLLAVGAALDDLLRQSRLVAPRIAQIALPGRAFDTCPRIHAQLYGVDWLACGTAALAFDPLCGDGTAQAVREAILAAAVIVARADGGDAPALMAHYQSLLTAAMRRHLGLCADFYRTGGDGPWWQSQLRHLVQGHQSLTAKLATVPEPRYQLRGFALVEREPAL